MEGFMIIMAKVKVTCEVNTYNQPVKPSIRVHNHWNIKDYVELDIDGTRYVVCGKELKIAVDNCINVGF